MLEMTQILAVRCAEVGCEERLNLSLGRSFEFEI